MTTPTAPSTDSSPFRDPLTEPGAGTRVKVCGITQPSEIGLLTDERADFVGLWLAVPGGPHDLAPEEWQALAEDAAGRPQPTPVLVTFTKDVEVLREAVSRTRVRWIQLHGYPTPGFVRKVKAIGPDVRVIKVLHVKGDECVEAALIGSYEKAGTDVFLFDTVSADGRVGSTGESLDAAVVESLIGRLTRPFLLAGGISAANPDRYEALRRHPLFLGIDVDTNARGDDGAIAAEPVRSIVAAWRGDDG